MRYLTLIHRNDHVRGGTLAILAVWFAAALAASLTGVFDSQERPPMAIAAAAFGPVTLFALGYLTSPYLRQLVRGADLGLLNLAHAWRIGGMVFVIEYARGNLPGVFALPAGWGDFAIGVTAPLVAFAFTSRRVGVIWNLLGLADLVMAVTLGVLASASPIGILATEVTTAPMGRFPLSLIPTFFVPLLMILHLIALAILGRAEQSHPFRLRAGGIG
jgi:hypothetical protein